MISLGFSAFLFGSALVAVPIILHLLKNKPKIPQGFPALVFLHATAAKKQNRNRLRKWLILILRCLVFCLIALTFAWPYISENQTEPDEAKVILWDNSFSMQDTNVYPILYDQAYNMIGETDSAHPLLIGAISDNIKWSGKFSSDYNTLEKWFKENSKSFGSSSFRQALRMADSKLQRTTAKKRTIILFTDQQFLPWENVELKKSLSPGIALKVITPELNNPINNTCITSIKGLKEYVKPEQEISFKVYCRNFNPKAETATLVIYLEDKELLRKKIELAPNSITQEYFNLKTPAGKLRSISGSVELRAVNDNLTIDNIHYFCLNPVDKAKFLVTPVVDKNRYDFIGAALKATNDNIYKLNSKLLKNTKLLILQDIKYFDDSFYIKLDEYLEKGGSIAIVWEKSKAMQSLLNHYGIKVVTPCIKGVKRFEMLNFKHPLFKDYLKVRAGAWFDILFFDVPKLKFPEDTRILATFDGNIPAITENNVKNGKLFVIASTLDRKHSNWPTFASFLPFWRELLLYSNRKVQSQYSLRVRQGRKNWNSKVEVISLSSKEKAKKYLPLNIPGNYLVKNAKGNKIYSINLLEKESQNTMLPNSYDFQKLVSKEAVMAKLKLKKDNINKLQNMQQAKNFWFHCLLLAMVLSFLEILLANRTAL